jgi:hypothetical protein
MLALMSEAANDPKACDVCVSWFARRLSVGSRSGTLRARTDWGIGRLLSADFSASQVSWEPRDTTGKVKIYRHGTSISDRACPKQSLTLIADQTALQTNSLSHFYQFLAEHRQTSNKIFATITGRLVNGEGGGFVPKRKVAFKLESVSEVSEGG